MPLWEKIKQALAAGPLSTQELSDQLGQKKRGGRLKEELARMRGQGLIEFTLPEQPKSPLQRHRMRAAAG